MQLIKVEKQTVNEMRKQKRDKTQSNPASEESFLHPDPSLEQNTRKHAMKQPLKPIFIPLGLITNIRDEITAIATNWTNEQQKSFPFHSKISSSNLFSPKAFVDNE